MFSGTAGKPCINQYLAALAYLPSKHVLWLKTCLPRTADHILGQKHVCFERKFQFVSFACLQAKLVTVLNNEITVSKIKVWQGCFHLCESNMHVTWINAVQTFVIQMKAYLAELSLSLRVDVLLTDVLFPFERDSRCARSTVRWRTCKC